MLSLRCSPQPACWMCWWPYSPRAHKVADLWLKTIFRPLPYFSVLARQIKKSMGQRHLRTVAVFRTANIRANAQSYSRPLVFPYCLFPFSDIIQDAFDVWSCYTGIRFRRVKDPTKATVFVVFGSSYHSAFLKGGVKTRCHLYEFSDIAESGCECHWAVDCTNNPYLSFFGLKTKDSFR